MCPGVRASGLKSVSGSITKHGNPRIRRTLIELAWRVVRYQPGYGPVLRWQAVLKQRNNPGARKKAVVAIGRRLAIDIWRLETGPHDDGEAPTNLRPRRKEKKEASEKEREHNFWN